MSEEEENEKEIWEVEKDFIQRMTKEIGKLSKQIKEQKKEIESLKENKNKNKDIETIDKDEIFRCAEVSFTDNPMDKASNEKKLKIFRNKLKRLMKEYRVGQCTAMFLHKM